MKPKKTKDNKGKCEHQFIEESLCCVLCGKSRVTTTIVKPDKKKKGLREIEDKIYQVLSGEDWSMVFDGRPTRHTLEYRATLLVEAIQELILLREKIRGIDA